MSVRVLLYSLMAASLIHTSAFAEKCEVEPYFSPRQSIQDVVVYYLWKAHKSVSLSLYGIQNPLIVNELISLKKHGVTVKVNVDKTQAAGRTSLVSQLQENGIPVLIKKTSALEHNKFAIVDYGTPDAFVFFGSWNFSNQADKQDNSSAVISGCPGVIQSFQDDFDFISRRDGGK